MTACVKICGITTGDAASVAHEAGAEALGFVHFEKSPRHLSIEAAWTLASELPKGPQRFGVLVNPEPESAAKFADALTLDALQLHGSESIELIKTLRQRTNCKIYKAIAIADRCDLTKAQPYAAYVDGFFFDAKPPQNSQLPGGNAVSFDWSIMQTYGIELPWYLAGGLNPENIAKAIQQSGADYVDVSSGVESALGIKSETLIKAFLKAANEAMECCEKDEA